MTGIKDTLKNLSDPVDNFIKSCEEMLKDSGEKGADYFEEKDIISRQLLKQQNNSKAIKEAQKLFLQKQKFIEDMSKEIKKPKAKLNNLLDQLDSQKVEIEEIYQQVSDLNDEFLEGVADFGDFWIPVNINHRTDELENLNEKLEIRIKEFEDLKKADEDFEGNKQAEIEIKTKLAEIKKRLDSNLKERDRITGVISKKL